MTIAASTAETVAGTAAEAAGHAAEGGKVDPLHQFTIERLIPLDLFGFDASFTNSSLFMVIALGVIVLFFLWAMGRRAIVPGRAQSIAELVYEFVAKTVRDSAGDEGMKYFPLIFTLFVFILVLNLLGLISIPGLPHPFTVTSHIIVTFALAALVFVTVTLVGFMRHGIGYLKLFVPAGVPWPMLILLVPIEFISYLIRPISLSVRLFANMMAGHTLLKVLAGFAASFLSAGGLTVLGVPVMVAVLVGFTGLEVLVACLQAFVFAVLTCIYLNDALHMHEHH